MSISADPASLKLCRYFSNGRQCNKKKECPFMHDQSLFNAAVKERKLAKMNTMCKYFSAGRKCYKGKDCPFVHDESLFKAAVERKLAKLKDTAGEAQQESRVQKDDYQKSQTPPEKARENQQQVTQAQPLKTLTVLPKRQHRKKTRKDGKPSMAVQTTENTQQISKDIVSSMKNESLPKILDCHPTGTHTKEFNISGHLPVRQRLDHGGSTNMASPFINAPKKNNIWLKGYPWKGPRNYKGNEPAPQPTELAPEPEKQEGKTSIPPLEGDDRAPKAPYGLGMPKDNTSQCATPPTFTLFPDLPTELRLPIWQSALRLPYQPTVRFSQVRDLTDSRLTSHRIRCRSLTPSLLRTCRESRAEALNHYSLCFVNSTYFNSLYDCVYFNTRNARNGFTTFMESIAQRELKSIQNLTLKLHDWTTADATNFSGQVRQLSNLKRLTLLVSDREENQCYLNAETAHEVRRELKVGRDKQSDLRAPKVSLVVVS